MLTAISVGIGAIILALGGSFILSKKGSSGGIGGALPLQSSSGVSASAENEVLSFSEQYQRDSVLTSSSSTPYISSQEIVRPQGSNDEREENVVYSSAEDKYNRTGTFFPFNNPNSTGAFRAFIGGYAVSDVLDSVSDIVKGAKGINWSLIGLIVGSVVVCEVLSDG